MRIAQNRDPLKPAKAQSILPLARDAASAIMMIVALIGERKATISQRKVFRSGEFAARAGVSIRTVRYYDRIGLLKPSGRSEAGQRLYSEGDFARLQQILTLKLIGLSLDEIKQVTAHSLALPDLLARQKAALKTQAQQLAAVIERIERAQAVIGEAEAPDFNTLIEIIKAVTMNMQTDWLGQFLTEEQRAQIANHTQGKSLDEQRQIGEAWRALFADIQTSMDKDANDPAVQALVERWDALLGEFSGDTAMIERLTNAYATVSGVLDAGTPENVRVWAGDLSAAAAFIERARRQ